MFYFCLLCEKKCDIHNIEVCLHFQMQMRFDGKLGFPGGFMDKGPHEQPVDALNRELVEEIALKKQVRELPQKVVQLEY